VQPLQPVSGPTPIPWDGASRVTVLVMGYDYGDWSDERKCPCRTDTMILLTIDPLTKSAGMLTIPRDMWVNIPGFEYGKINTAHYLGDLYQLPGGGPGLAMKTVEEFIGVPVNYYALIDFAAFERMVDEIGGIEIDVPAEIKVDPIGKGNTVVLQPGLQTLSGPVALAYARNRYTDGGDFDRGTRQLQVIRAARNKILKLNMLPTLVQKAPALYGQLSAGIQTNLTLDQVIQLAWLAVSVPEENIKQGVIGPPDQVTFGTSPDGLDILLPVSDAIRLLRDEIFTAAGPVSPVSATGDPRILMQAEGARVQVLNGTYTVGLASTTAEYLKSLGVNVTLMGNANENYAVTTIIDYTGKPYTVQYLITLMNIQSMRHFSSYDPNSEVDVVIMLGADWANSNPMP
jgi:LCP family protein required for cell wall assembly